MQVYFNLRLGSWYNFLTFNISLREKWTVVADTSCPVAKVAICEGLHKKRALHKT